MNVLLAASDSWSLGDALLLTIEIFLFVIWIWIFISIVVDLFRDHDRSIQEQIDMQKAANDYIRQVSGSPVDDLQKLSELKDKGVKLGEGAQHPGDRVPTHVPPSMPKK